MGLFLIRLILSSLSFNIGPFSSLTISGDDRGDGDGVGEIDEEHTDDTSEESEDTDDVEAGEVGFEKGEDQFAVDGVS